MSTHVAVCAHVIVHPPAFTPMQIQVLTRDCPDMIMTPVVMGYEVPVIMIVSM